MYKVLSVIFRSPLGVAVFLLLLGSVVWCPLSALAGDNPVTVPVTLGATTGTGAYTNTRDYTTMQLVSIEVFQSLNATSTCTVTRVRSGRTNTVAAIALTGAACIYRETNTTYLFKNDVLNFANGYSTGAVVEITGKLHP